MVIETGGKAIVKRTAERYQGAIGKSRAVVWEMRKSMDKKTKELALSKGATTEMDFTLFANLHNLRKQFKKQLGQMKMPTGIPPPRGILLRYDFFLERGRFFKAQPLPKGYRRESTQA